MPLSITLESSDGGRRHGVELLALTKLNWNHSRLDGHDPITTHAARTIGSILRQVEPDGLIGNRYAFYMQVVQTGARAGAGRHATHGHRHVISVPSMINRIRATRVSQITDPMEKRLLPDTGHGTRSFARPHQPLHDRARRRAHRIPASAPHDRTAARGRRGQ